MKHSKAYSALVIAAAAHISASISRKRLSPKSTASLRLPCCWPPITCTSKIWSNRRVPNLHSWPSRGISRICRRTANSAPYHYSTACPDRDICSPHLREAGRSLSKWRPYEFIQLYCNNLEIDRHRLLSIYERHWASSSPRPIQNRDPGRIHINGKKIYSGIEFADSPSLHDYHFSGSVIGCLRYEYSVLCLLQQGKTKAESFGKLVNQEENALSWI